jgi:ammonium transporter, Amt family
MDGSADNPYVNAYAATNGKFASFIGTGDAAWQSTASTLVGLQSLLGLVFIYGGLAKKKWVVNSVFMVLYAFCASFITWVIVGYQIAFGKGWISLHSFFGTPNSDQLTVAYLEKQATLVSTYDLWFQDTYVVSPYFSNATMVYFQGMFCCITPVLIAGALLARTKFLAWMIFVPMWIILSYCPGAFTMWAGGYFYKKGVMDFAGGYVIHLSAGTASFVAAAIIGPRLRRDREKFPPSNVVLALGGAGVLWLGWNGFNGGATYSAMPISAIAILNTNIAAAVSCMTWTLCDFLFFKKPSVIGAIQGIITGLVIITPCAGLIEPWAAIIAGFVAGTVPWVSMMIVGKRSVLFKWVDDTLGVFHTHAVAGFLGGIMAGLFAEYHLAVDHFGLEPKSDSFYGTQGAFYGGWQNLGWQLAASFYIITLNLIMTPLILYFIKYVLRVPLRMSEEHLEIGDNAAHGEEAYALYGDGELDSVGWYDYEQTHHGTAAPIIKPSAEERNA